MRIAVNPTVFNNKDYTSLLYYVEPLPKEMVVVAMSVDATARGSNIHYGVQVHREFGLQFFSADMMYVTEATAPTDWVAVDDKKYPFQEGQHSFKFLPKELVEHAPSLFNLEEVGFVANDPSEAAYQKVVERYELLYGGLPTVGDSIEWLRPVEDVENLIEKSLRKLEEKDIKKLMTCFPIAIALELTVVLGGLRHLFTGNTISLRDRTFSVDGETVGFLYRLYIAVNHNKIENLEGERAILYHCLMSRHHMGWQRQRSIEFLVSQKSLPNWAMPYLLMALGDYVYEIARPVIECANEDILQQLRDFCRDNPQMRGMVETQAVNYWMCYYNDRPWTTYKDYPPFVFIRSLRFKRMRASNRR